MLWDASTTGRDDPPCQSATMSSDTLSGSYFPSYNSISTPQDFSWSWTTSSLTATGARVVTDLEYDSPSDVPKTSLQPLTTIYNPPASCATFTSILTYRIPFPTENGAKNPPTNEFSQTPMYRYPMTGGKEQSCLPLSVYPRQAILLPK